jgi:zinc transport system ATP-binding protein
VTEPQASTAPHDIPPLLLEARDVRVSLQGNPILHGVTAHVARGEVVALMGGNGSGKSTFVRSVVGAVPLSSGEIRLGGHTADARARATLGYVPQRLTASGGVSATAREVVASGLLGHRRLRPPRDHARRVHSALERMGVAELARRDVGRLSGGQQQRVLIARALVRDPHLLILDEPLAGVDLESQVAFAHALGHLKEEGVGILIVLHELGPIARHIDRAVVLEAGCVTHEGPPPKDLGVHALPGHDHDHPHEGPPVPHPGTIGLEAP